MALEALFAGSGGVAFPRMTALVGAGGKTTLMYALARRMADAGRRVVCTTTTKIFPPEVASRGSLGRRGDPVAAVHDALSAAPVCCGCRASAADVRKLDGVSPRMLAVLSAALPEALFLVEADGAARKPLKAPAAHEPVLPEPLGCCVAVVGLDSVGQPLDDGHVHRSALVCAAAGRSRGVW